MRKLKMNHDILSLAVKFIFPAHKVVGNIEDARFADDVEYRHDIFEKVLSIDVADLNEIALDLRTKLDLKESVTSSSAYKDVQIDFNYYKGTGIS